MDETHDPHESSDGPGAEQQSSDADADEAYDLNEDTSFVRPFSSPKTWAVLAGIFVVIAVAILYVYQTGDNKTVLGNRPIPAQQAFAYAQPPVAQVAALNVPGGGFSGGSTTGTPAPKQCPAGGTPQSSVQCPRCGTKGMPLCSSCGAVMHPLGHDPNSHLFACPSCGTVGIMICPRCGAEMTSVAKSTGQLVKNAQSQVAGNVGGQFQCPTCGATGFPNWNANGAPICPNCGAQMNTTARTAPRLAAAP